MVEDSGVDQLIRQWTAERSDDADKREADRIKSAWLAEVPPARRGVPGPRGSGGFAELGTESAELAYVAVMRRRLPDVPEMLLSAAARWWQLVGDITEAEQWWDAGISPLDQRALEYRAAGLTPSDLGRRLGPMTVLQHLRRGSAAAWCTARLQRQRRDGVA